MLLASLSNHDLVSKAVSWIFWEKSLLASVALSTAESSAFFDFSITLEKVFSSSFVS